MPTFWEKVAANFWPNVIALVIIGGGGSLAVIFRDAILEQWVFVPVANYLENKYETSSKITGLDSKVSKLEGRIESLEGLVPEQTSTPTQSEARIPPIKLYISDRKHEQGALILNGNNRELTELTNYARDYFIYPVGEQRNDRTPQLRLEYDRMKEACGLEESECLDRVDAAARIHRVHTEAFLFKEAFAMAVIETG